MSVVIQDRITMSVDPNDLPSADEHELAYWLMTSGITSGSGPDASHYTSTDIEKDTERKEAIRVELKRRGYSDGDVLAIESGEWTMLDGRNAI